MKKKKIIKFIAIFTIFCSLFTMPSFAHSGRTDSSGGHKDNKNKSGLGSYHYHCGGYPAHLHTSGVCPYKTSSVSATTNTKTKEVNRTTQAVEAPKIGIVATDIKTLINNNEIPTFIYNGDPNSTVIIAEDLGNYGFDKAWNQETKTLTITKNAEKELKPMCMEYYNGLKQGQFMFDVIQSDIKVHLKASANSEIIEATKIYFLNGYTAISTDELKNFGEFNWDNENRKIEITIK